MTNYFRLRRITLRAGSGPDAPPATITPGSVTIAVGPNNSGKSLLLKELKQWSGGGQEPPLSPWPGGEVLSGADAYWPADEAALEGELAGRLVPDQAAQEGYRMIYSFQPEIGGAGGMAGSGEVQVQVRNHWGISFGEFCRTMVMQHFRMRLDGRQRFSLAEPRQVTSIDRGPSSALMAVWLDGAKYGRVREAILAATGRHFVVNTADLPNLSASLSDIAPPDGSERSLERDAIAYQRSATPLQSFSDGIQVYTGLVTAVHSLPHKLLLVDEPEAYLHPTLARRLGGELASVARQRDASLVVATHSADFLMGCVSEVPETSIVRLTYEASVATARVLDGADVAALTRDPLLRSASALRALFSHATVVCEADSDRAFYEEINRRLEVTSAREGSEDTTFLNAQNWQTIPSVAGPLRRLGIPAAMILDLDTLIEGDGWSDIIKSFGLEASTAGALTQRRSECGQLLAAAGRVAGQGTPYAIKKDGIDALDEVPKVTVTAFLDELAQYGVFVVPVGELENWLRPLGVTNKQRWVTEMLVRLGSYGTETYVAPGAGDVWTFCEQIARWTGDPNRQGIPNT
jgi:hypothetical protein